MALTPIDYTIVFLASVLPPVVYVMWLRKAEVCDRESVRNVLLAMGVGAAFSLSISYVAESLLLTFLFGDGISTRPFWSLDPDGQLIILACVVAPIVEEGAKGIGTWFFRRKFNELENGLVYGAAVGLGFAAFENVLYESNAISVGLSVFIGTAVARALTSTALHASASAIMGYGLSRKTWLAKQGRTVSWVPYYLIAVGLHSLFNLLAITGSLVESDLIYVGALVASLVLVQQTIKWIRQRIEEPDRTYACRPDP